MEMSGRTTPAKEIKMSMKPRPVAEKPEASPYEKFGGTKKAAS